MAGTGILTRLRIGAAVLASFITDPLRRFWCTAVGHWPQKVTVTALVDGDGRASLRNGVIVTCQRCNAGLEAAVWVDPIAGQLVLRGRG